MKNYSIVDSDLVNKIILPRSKQSRKGDNGITLIVGGSRIYHGAPLLSSIAALRSGTDLVYTAIPKINLSPSRNFSADLIFVPFPDDKLTSGAVRRLLNTIPKKIGAAGIGMGLSFSKSQSLLTLIDGLIKQDARLLIDAGALIPEILSHIVNTRTVITPHAGEFKRLFGDLPTEVLDEQIRLVTKKAKEHGLVITLKGFWNIVSDGDQTFVSQRTTPAMTVGGTGDILSGLVAGYLTKYDSIHACILGLYFNGLAGLNIFNKLGLHMVASDLLAELPSVMKDFDKISD
ncbi:NAD(P)H-hydrate dehydratase [Candidatus Nitrosocosmicus hydrocola]|uniref:NAD(P)H-hydrate dehydratase n=1 Tax=Candidatus Nitrosocosmicus hydrocola TaxID=1826872 RepID=UPI000AB12B94|nr:NAD(P)H-hydrate dehydratase [Candidatus Nitrosocosmicus hydrocola]